MFNNMIQIEKHICKEKLEVLRKRLHTLTEEAGNTSVGVLKVSNELDECILLFMKLDKKC